MMHFGKSKLLLIIMAVVMLFMLSQGFRGNNLMVVMMAVMAIVAMGFLMKRKTPNP